MANGNGVGPASVIDANTILVQTGQEELDQEFFNSRFTRITSALNSLASRTAAIEGVESTLVADGLERLNALLEPIVTSLQNAADQGFLVVGSVGGPPMSLTAGLGANWTITTPDTYWMPTPYLLAQDNTDSTNWGVVQLVAWAPATNQLTTTVIFANKTQASSSWTISDNAGLYAALAALASQTAANAATVAAATSSITGYISTLTTLITEIEAGAVLSVAGHTGDVILSITDVSGLQAALNGRATTAALATALTTVQPISANLTAFADLALSSGQLIYASGAASLALASLSDYGITLIGAANAGSAKALLAIESSDITATAADATTSIALALTDNGCIKNLNSATPITVTLPFNLPKNFNCMIHQQGVGQVTFQVDGLGAVLNHRLGYVKTAGRFAVASLYVFANADNASANYVLGGDVAP